MSGYTIFLKFFIMLVSICIVLGERTNDAFCLEVMRVGNVELVINSGTHVLVLGLTLNISYLQVYEN